jgi:hypothetical protein
MREPLGSLLREWPVTVLDRAGQQAFWDRQAPDYDQADMTRDNEGELDLVRALCQQFCLSGYKLDDVVTLGGAVGSRDPKVVMEVFERHSMWPEHIYFNDLSGPMTEHALKGSLASYPRDQTKVVAIPGPVHEIAKHIPPIPRRVIIGVYRAEAFTTANPHYGYPLTGLEEYEKNADRIGTHLIIRPVRLTDEEYIHMNTRMLYSSEYEPERKSIVQTHIAQCVNIPPMDAIQVIGTHHDREGYFLSHWFTECGIRRLIAQSFNPERIVSMSLMSCSKGFVLCIDPVDQPRGIVTILNNVMGNILPNEQIRTLRAIDMFSK